MILALAGGVGGAKLAAGLAQTLAPDELVLAVNTGDDFEHLGLHVSPDLDTVMYTLAGIANPHTGWGRADESWNFMHALEHLGGPTWFRLGDRDLATNVERTRRLREQRSLSEVTRELCDRLSVRHAVVPMSDDPLRTVLHTDEGVLDFQEYFVRRQCRPRVRKIEYRGSDVARPSPGLWRALHRRDLRGVIVCPSNPYLSIAPILALRGVREAIAACRKVVAVCPVVAGEAVKGPAAKIMRELEGTSSALGVARFYASVASTMVIDRKDESLVRSIESSGMRVAVEDTLMHDSKDRVRVARACLQLLPPQRKG